MKYIYAPGCALVVYKPHLAERLKEVVEAHYSQMPTLLSCCFNRPELDADTCIITPCSTCREQYRKHYPQCSTLYFLKELAESSDFEFPDYRGAQMSIQDTCSGRTDDEYLSTVRRLLQRMNIEIVEAEKSGRRGKCCGQALYGKLPIEKVERFMIQRAEEMPCQDVVVYCASCIQSMTVGGRRPRYLLDLLFGEQTTIAKADIVAWNQSLVDFRKKY